MHNLILVLNAGSSSLKFSVIDETSGTRPFEGIAECLGEENACLHLKEQEKTHTFTLKDNHQPMQSAIALLMKILPESLVLTGVGHRVVHGGERFRKATLINDEVLEEIKACSSLAPLHNPCNIEGIYATKTLFPDLPQAAVFDTSFHSQLPAHAFHYAIPMHFYKKYGVRKYGFHGTSHHYVALKAAQIFNRDLDELELITAHLGNGCSVSAIREGHSIDTSMGMTPLAGVMMGTRSGDVDPGLICWLAQQQNMSIQQIDHMLNKESGLFGVSSLSNDMRTLEDAAQKDHQGARLAIDIFCYRIAQSIAAMSVGLNNPDALIFTGGIGENSPLIRHKIVAQLRQLNFFCDEVKNNRKNYQGSVNKNDSKSILVIPTDEELMIAKQTCQLIKEAL
ncbi:MAG: acetate kinase [Endozoicomonadaceae bacterium]|nr:acetate kinase [Endozoicomonadaceae bacterium]MCY4330062.1 acetate kinase [Endozoicomonadaceae bacterium]